MEKIDFPSLLASIIHDMKNSLGTVLGCLDELVSEQSDVHLPHRVVKLQHMAGRLNNRLVQLLAFYKLENTGLAAHITENRILDFLEECMFQEKPVLDSIPISVTIECAEDLWGYFDRELVRGAIGNAIDNAIRYTHDRLLIKAREEDGYLAIRINDSGPGFPRSMLGSGGQHSRGVSFSTGSTGLGLYFSSRIAALHKNRDREGYIELANGFELGGGCFSIYLP